MKKPYIEKLKQMKKIGLLLLAAVAAAGLSSCNDTKVDQPGNMSFVTVRTLSTSDYYFAKSMLSSRMRALPIRLI